MAPTIVQVCLHISNTQMYENICTTRLLTKEGMCIVQCIYANQFNVPVINQNRTHCLSQCSPKNSYSLTDKFHLFFLEFPWFSRKCVFLSIRLSLPNQFCQFIPVAEMLPGICQRASVKQVLISNVTWHGGITVMASDSKTRAGHVLCAALCIIKNNNQN